MKEFLRVGDRVSLIGTYGRGEVTETDGRMIRVRWDRIGLLSRSRRTWEPRGALHHVPQE